MKDIIQKIIENSFNKMCEYDYACKYTENEEDERAALYRYIRNIQEQEKDKLSNLRVFLSYSLPVKGEKTKKVRPDILIASHENNYTNIKTQAIIEMKNWPSKSDIQEDINKLKKYGEALQDDNPLLYFLAVVGNGFKNINIENYIKNELIPDSNIIVKLRKHSELYEGPWCSKYDKDPWRKKYDEIKIHL